MDAVLEEEQRFEITQQLGMDKREIKRSVHSQGLTVVSLPLFAVSSSFAPLRSTFYANYHIVSGERARK